MGVTTTTGGEEQGPTSKPVKASQSFNLKSTLEAVQADLAEPKATVHATQVVGRTIQPNSTQKDDRCVSHAKKTGAITVLNVGA